MNKSIARFFLFLLLFGCTKENVSPNGDEETGDIIPTQLSLDVALQGQQSNPQGDGSGIAFFTATGTNAASFDFRIDGGDAIESSSGKLTHTFTEVGTNSYKITAIAYSPTKHSDSISTEVIVRVAPPPCTG